jgi:hypothetical protein
MKSVLGGLFRINNSTLDDVHSFIYGLTKRVLNEKGALISVDNGKSFLEHILSNYGARKNKWRFFLKSDLNMSVNQFSFGLIQSFSVGTRLGFLGDFIDNCLVYPVDYALCKIIRNKPTVILSIFLKNPQ